MHVLWALIKTVSRKMTGRLETKTCSVYRHRENRVCILAPWAQRAGQETEILFQDEFMNFRDPGTLLKLLILQQAKCS